MLLPMHYNEATSPCRSLNETDVPACCNKVAEADFPSRSAISASTDSKARYGGRSEEAVVPEMGDIARARPAAGAHPFQCLTGDVFHSLRCDCRAQLEIALDLIAEEGRGLLIYEHQEGRGIGLLNKLRAYELQDGARTRWRRTSGWVLKPTCAIMKCRPRSCVYFKVKSVRLLSNNPDKIAALERSPCIHVAERIPCIVAPHESTEGYLRTKKQKMGHLLD